MFKRNLVLLAAALLSSVAFANESANSSVLMSQLASAVSTCLQKGDSELGFAPQLPKIFAALGYSCSSDPQFFLSYSISKAHFFDYDADMKCDGKWLYFRVFSDYDNWAPAKPVISAGDSHSSEGLSTQSPLLTINFRTVDIAYDDYGRENYVNSRVSGVTINPSSEVSNGDGQIPIMNQSTPTNAVFDAKEYVACLKAEIAAIK